MGRIRQMDDHLATLIAAGEVVTGPVSVVRELVDNALDAGAQTIDVALEEGGLRSIRVADDGSGMDEADAVLCLSRHATSKLTAAEELASIHTLGFRGEALAAILAVSQLRLETRREEDAAGTLVRAAGGEVSEVRPTARRPGTTVEVGQLFYNTPARREFLDSPRAEGGRVLQALQRVAIARPETRFSLRSGEREVLNLPGTEVMLERIRQVYDSDFADELIPIFGQRGDVVVSGYVARPSASVRQARRNTFIVNGRPFESFEIRRLLTTTFGPLLSPGHHVEAIVCIDLPPTEVDVNVSPDKSRVRFRRPGQVLAAVTDALRYALGESETVATLTRRPEPLPEPLPTPTTTPRPSGDRSGYPPHQGGAGRVREEPQGNPDAWALMFGDRTGLPRPSAPPPTAADPSLVPDGWVHGEPEPPAAARHGIPLRPAAILQVSNTFLVCAVEDGVLVVDQHSAHERVNYERLRARFERDGRNADVQPLMFPEALRLDAERVALLEEMLPLLERLGFELSPAGPREMLIQAAPAALGDRSIPQALEKLMEAYAAARELGVRSDEAATAITPVEDRLLMTMACHAAVKAGQPLAEPEIRALWADLVRVDLAAHDVHGRPGVVHLPATELARRLGRSL